MSCAPEYFSEQTSVSLRADLASGESTPLGPRDIRGLRTVGLSLDTGGDAVTTAAILQSAGLRGV